MNEGVPAKAGPPAVVEKQTSMLPAVQQPAAPVPQPTGLAPGSTDGLSMIKLDPKALEALTREPDPETEVEIRPDGIVYMPAIVLRCRLDEAFGPGQWAIRQEREPFYDAETRECVYDGSLWVRGQFASRSLGGCRWNPKNAQMTKTDAIEGAKSDCLRRCCKDLGVGRGLWLPAWVRQFTADYAVPYQGTNWQNKPCIKWRKKGTPLSGEALASAASIAGEFPLGFGPGTPLPDGTYAGTPIKDVPLEVIEKMGEKAGLIEWRLVAKAEIVRRCNEATKTAMQSEEEPTADDVIGGDEEPEASPDLS